MKTIIQQRLADAVTMDLPEVIERECRLPKIPNKAYAIIGMRRTGKTYFLYQTMKRCLEQGVDRSRLVYFNFEDERLADISDPITRERECRALYEAGSAMPDAHLLLINISEESTIKTESGTIRIIPAWKWLLKS